MAKTNAMLSDEGRDQPINLGDRAIDNLQFIRETLKLGQPSEHAITDRAGGPRRAHWRTLGAECFKRGPDGYPRSIPISAQWVGTRECLWQGWVYIVRPEI